MQIQNIWLDTFARCVKTKFSGRELGMGCITTSYTSRVITVFTQWRKEKYSTALCGDANIWRCIWQGHIQNAGRNEATPSRHSHFMLDVRPRWRRLRGRPETRLKLDVSTELTNVYKQVYCTLRSACRQKGSGLRGLDEMVWKTHAFSGKARSAHQPHPKQTKTKIFFSHSIHKKKHPVVNLYNENTFWDLHLKVHWGYIHSHPYIIFTSSLHSNPNIKKAPVKWGEMRSHQTCLYGTSTLRTKISTGWTATVTRDQSLTLEGEGFGRDIFMGFFCSDANQNTKLP